MLKLGLIGKKLGHSFSKLFFEKLFQDEHQPGTYDLIELKDSSAIVQLKNNNYNGLNVTIPYKEAVIPFLDELSIPASAVGAVNCIEFLKGGLTRGHNTDIIGFEETLLPLIKNRKDIKSALVLGSGGGAKAVCFVLKKLNISYNIVSRNPKDNWLAYQDLNHSVISDVNLIINATPLGMFPDTHSAPLIPYDAINQNHILYDLVYNPEETLFMKRGKEKGAVVCNGLSMLYAQAIAAWKIWNKNFCD
jgi:shikimate dehydrogenase